MIPPQLTSTLDNLRISRVATDVSRVQDITTIPSDVPFRLDHNVPPDSSNTAFRVDVKALCAQMVHQFAIFGATATTSFDPKVELSLPLWPLAMLTFEYISFLGTVLAQGALRESSVCVGQPGGV